jgi:hypothetical protein
MKGKIADKKFLKVVCEVIDEPGTDVAVTYLAEIVPGMLLARETDGEVVVNSTSPSSRKPLRSLIEGG